MQALLRRTKRRRRNPFRRAALAVAGVAVTITFATAVLFFTVLGAGPIRLDWLQPSIAANLQSRLRPGYTVALGPVSLTHGPFGLGIGFSGLAVRDPDGRLMVGAPAGSIGLDVFALLRLDVKVRRLELDGLQLALQVAPDGSLSLAAAAADDASRIPLGVAPAAPLPTRPGALLASLATAMTGQDQPLDHLAIRDGGLTVENAARGAPKVYRDFTLRFDRTNGSARITTSADGPAGRWNIEALAEAGINPKIAIQAHDLSAEDFSRLDPHPAKGTFDSPISFDLTAAAAPDGTLSAFEAAFSLGAGKFDPNDPDTPSMAIDEATGRVSLGPDGDYRIDKIEILAGDTHARLTGAVTPPRASDTAWRLKLHSSDTVFAGIRAQDPAAKFDAVDADAHLDVDSKTFVLDRLAFKGPKINGEGSATARLTDDGPAAKFQVSGSGALVEALRLWPTFVNPDARRWCMENVKGGQLASGSLKVDWDAAALKAVLDKKAAPADSVAGQFSLRDVAVDLLPGLPTTSGLDATGEITGRTFHVSAPKGVMELGAGRKLSAADLSFVVPDTAPAPRVAASASARISGGVDSLADLLMRDAMKRYVGVTLDPSTIHGQAQGDLKLDLTLGKGVQPEEQKFRATGQLSNLSLDKFLGPTKLEQGAIDFTADRDAVKMSGVGVALGAPSRLELTKGAQDVGALTLTTTLDEAARTRMGFTAGPKVRGSLTLKLKAPLDKSGADVEVDLAKTTIDSLGGPAWKAAGKPGKATFSLRPANGDQVQVTNIAVDAGVLSARGSALFGAEGAMKSLKLAPFRMTAGDDLKLDVEGGTTPKVTVRGAALDVKGFVKALTASQSEPETSSLSLDIKVAEATGFNRERISGFDFSALKQNGAFTSIEARGRLGQGAFSARGSEAGLITVKADDAGALAKFLDLYNKLEGGAIELSVRQSGEGARGSAVIRKFVVRDEPALRQLEQSAPPPQNNARGGASASGADAGHIVKFDKLTGNFARNGGRLEVRDVVIYNAGFGLTAQGFLDWGRDQTDISGAYIPMYQFNNLPGGIPVLGTLLTGGEHEGMFSINYHVSGALSAPSFSINPFSPLTPGIFRKMFSVFDQAPATPNLDDTPSSYAPGSPAR